MLDSLGQRRAARPAHLHFLEAAEQVVEPLEHFGILLRRLAQPLPQLLRAPQEDRYREERRHRRQRQRGQREIGDISGHEQQQQARLRRRDEARRQVGDRDRLLGDGGKDVRRHQPLDPRELGMPHLLDEAHTEIVDDALDLAHRLRHDIALREDIDGQAQAEHDQQMQIWPILPGMLSGRIDRAEDERIGAAGKAHHERHARRRDRILLAEDP